MSAETYPPKIDRDNRDNRDKSLKALQHKGFVFPQSIFRPGHNRDTPGQSSRFFVIKSQKQRERCLWRPARTGRMSKKQTVFFVLDQGQRRPNHAPRKRSSAEVHPVLDHQGDSAMKPPALEIRLILSAPGMGWEYVARRGGEAIAASDGDGYENPGRALVACVAEVKTYVAGRQAGNEGKVL